MGDIVLQYNGLTISPTPLVSQNYEFLDYGTRWGNIANIELNGYITGVQGTVGSQIALATYFSGQFGTLTMWETGTVPILIHQWNNIIVDDIMFNSNHLFINSIAPYTVKLRSINVPSGVIEPTNEYSFVQGDDGIVSVNHKASAKGVRTSIGGLQNAINFISGFVGQNPFGNVGIPSNSLAAAFSPAGSGTLMSFTEHIDRAAGIYSIEEVYRYNTGLFVPYTEQWNVSTSDTFDNEWLLIDVDWKLQGSPVYDNMPIIESQGYVGSLLGKLSLMGYNTGNFVQASFSANKDTGTAVIQIKASYISGYSINDIMGYFDYIVSFDNDLTIPKEIWRIDADFICYGPRDYRVSRINNVKSVSGQSAQMWIGNLSGMIVGSPIYQNYHGTTTFGYNPVFDIHENPNIGQLHVSLVMEDGSYPSTLKVPTYSIEVSPNKWMYDLIPSANIEGHYILQDLQMMSQGKVSITVNGQSLITTSALATASGFLGQLTTMYIPNGFVTALNYNTGIMDVSCSAEILGLDLMGSGLTFTKMAGTTLTNYLRIPGYKFGF